MTAAAKEKREVTLPEGVSLRRVAEVLLDAWEADPRRWMNAASRLREGPSQPSSMPVPQDALDLFRLLAERRVEYLLVGGLAMLTYIKGRNTKDVDLLMSVGALEQLPELNIEDRKDFFARGKFRSIQVDLRLTINPLFKMVAEKFATQHSFEELEVPATTAKGLILLKLYALPSLYRQFDWDRISVYQGDISALLARYQPNVEALLKLLEPHVSETDLGELKKIVSEEQTRIKKAKDRFQS